MFDRVQSFLVKNANILGDSFLQNCSKVPTFVFLFIYMLDLGIFHFCYISGTRNVNINNINDNNNGDYDNDNRNNNVIKDKALHRHFPKDSCYKSEDSRAPEHYHILEQHLFSLYNTVYIDCMVFKVVTLLAQYHKFYDLKTIGFQFHYIHF